MVSDAPTAPCAPSTHASTRFISSSPSEVAVGGDVPFRIRALARLLLTLTRHPAVQQMPSVQIPVPHASLLDAVTKDVMLRPVVSWRGDPMDEETAVFWIGLCAIDRSPDTEALDVDWVALRNDAARYWDIAGRLPPLYTPRPAVLHDVDGWIRRCLDVPLVRRLVRLYVPWAVVGTSFFHLATSPRANDSPTKAWVAQWLSDPSTAPLATNSIARQYSPPNLHKDTVHESAALELEATAPPPVLASLRYPAWAVEIDRIADAALTESIIAWETDRCRKIGVLRAALLNQRRQAARRAITVSSVRPELDALARAETQRRDAIIVAFHRSCEELLQTNPRLGASWHARAAGWHSSSRATTPSVAPSAAAAHLVSSWSGEVARPSSATPVNSSPSQLGGRSAWVDSVVVTVQELVPRVAPRQGTSPEFPLPQGGSSRLTDKENGSGLPAAVRMVDRSPPAAHPPTTPRVVQAFTTEPQRTTLSSMIQRFMTVRRKKDQARLLRTYVTCRTPTRCTVGDGVHPVRDESVEARLDEVIDEPSPAHVNSVSRRARCPDQSSVKLRPAHDDVAASIGAVSVPRPFSREYLEAELTCMPTAEYVPAAAVPHSALAVDVPCREGVSLPRKATKEAQPSDSAAAILRPMQSRARVLRSEYPTPRKQPPLLCPAVVRPSTNAPRSRDSADETRLSVFKQGGRLSLLLGSELTMLLSP